MDESDSLAGRRVGTYDVLSLIGEGGMGRVYRARDVRLEGRSP
jgi:serine/threonine protein kinase